MLIIIEEPLSFDSSGSQDRLCMMTSRSITSQKSTEDFAIPGRKTYSKERGVRTSFIQRAQEQIFEDPGQFKLSSV